MSDRDRLVKHLENLRASGKAEATLNIEWLLSVFAAPVASEAPPKPEMPPNEVWISGGKF